MDESNESHLQESLKRIDNIINKLKEEGATEEEIKWWLFEKVKLCHPQFKRYINNELRFVWNEHIFNDSVADDRGYRKGDKDNLIFASIYLDNYNDYKHVYNSDYRNFLHNKVGMRISKIVGSRAEIFFVCDSTFYLVFKTNNPEEVEDIVLDLLISICEDPVILQKEELVPGWRYKYDPNKNIFFPDSMISLFAGISNNWAKAYRYASYLEFAYLSNLYFGETVTNEKMFTLMTEEVNTLFDYLMDLKYNPEKEELRRALLPVYNILGIQKFLCALETMRPTLVPYKNPAIEEKQEKLLVARENFSEYKNSLSEVRLNDDGTLEFQKSLWKNEGSDQ